MNTPRHPRSAGDIVFAVLVAMTMGVVDAAASANKDTRPAQIQCGLRMHVIDAVPLSPLSMKVLREQIERIWTPHGIEFEWRSGPPQPAPAHPGVIVLVLAPVHHRADATGMTWWAGIALGSVGFTEPVSPMNVLRIQVAPEALTARARLNGQPLTTWPPTVQQRVVGLAIGRIAAHELGHYLLASRQHASSGVMRASFSIGELQSEDLSAFTLDAAHAALLGTMWAHLTICAQRPEVASR